MQLIKCTICTSPGIYGKDINFNRVDFFGLRPGSKVLSIGDGRENGTIRTDEFTHPHEYVGSINIDGVEFFAFLIPAHIVAGTENMDPEYEYYLLYEKSDSEIYRYCNLRRQFFIRWIKPVFKIVN